MKRKITGKVIRLLDEKGWGDKLATQHVAEVATLDQEGCVLETTYCTVKKPFSATKDPNEDWMVQG